MRVAPPGSPGSYGRSPAGDAFFTDRGFEAAAFDAALSEFRRRLDVDTTSGVARHNVLAFHGVGGIGKTTLSKRLESWVTGRLATDDRWGTPPIEQVSITARIDLHDSAGQFDVLQALSSLRSSLSQVKRRWPTFDLAFAAYWSAVKPGEPLPHFGGHDDFGDAVAETVSAILGDVASLTGLAATGTGTSLGIRAVRYLIGQLRRRRDLQQALRAYEGFDDFLLQCADSPSPTNLDFTLACEIAGTLSWDLSELSATPLTVVFVDTTEKLTLDARRVAEAYLNHLIYRMPNVLFVVTGRNRLDWDSELRSDLPYSGPWTWPGLTTSAQDEPRQHLVGNLAAEDARALIVSARDGENLPISDDVIDELVSASAGLPQYLELARQVAASIRSAGNGREVTTGDVTGSIHSLVNRVLDDIPADEQRVIRAAALFRAFNVDLVAAAADVDHGCAIRATQRPMIDPNPDNRFPYRLHDAIRSAIRSADHQVAGGWAERDWESASTRAVAAARLLHDQAKEAGYTRDVLDLLGVAISLVCDQNTLLEKSMSVNYQDWLSQAVVFAPSVQGLRARIPTSSTTAYGQHIIDFVVGKSTDTPFQDRLRILRAIFDSDHPLRFAAGRHLGYALKAQHRWDEALDVFDELATLAPTDVNIGQRPLTLALARRFHDAISAAQGTPREAIIQRVTDYAHGFDQRYFDEIPQVMSKLRARGRQREYLDEEGDYLARRAFFRGPSLTEEEIELFRDEAEQSGNVYALRCALQAAVIWRTGDAADRGIALQQLKTLDKTASARGTIGFRYAFTEACDALMTGDWLSRLERLRSEIEQVDFRTRSWIPVECFLRTVGISLPPTTTQWIHAEDVVRERWRTHLSAYLARHGRTLPGEGAGL